MDRVPIAVFLLLFVPAWAADELIRRQRSRYRAAGVDGASEDAH